MGMGVVLCCLCRHNLCHSDVWMRVEGHRAAPPSWYRIASSERRAHCAPRKQVEGKSGLPKLAAKVRAGGPTVLYHGALAASAATFVGHYPWCGRGRGGGA